MVGGKATTPRISKLASTDVADSVFSPGKSNIEHLTRQVTIPVL